MRGDDTHRAIIDSVHKAYDPLIGSYVAQGSAHGRIAMRQLVTLNAGIAFAAPALAVAVGGEATLAPTLLALAGAVCAAVVNVIAYWNYTMHANDLEYERNWTVSYFDRPEFVPGRLHSPPPEPRGLVRARKINALYYVGWVTGVGSVGFMAAAIIAFALSLGA